ncbi:hypothetical protein HQ489_02080 [Candidatus Woesearchaeota archaeon]|nr:hypothetical protein [Candidatus Woesearchaeota archaeon]
MFFKRFILLLILILLVGCSSEEVPDVKEAIEPTPLVEEIVVSNDMPVLRYDVPEMVVEDDEGKFSGHDDSEDPYETCPDPLILETPVDLKPVTSILYPGQERGGDFKPHGGFRFDNSDSKISVKMPMDGFLTRGSRYIHGGELQYMFDFKNSCGISIRFGHLKVLSPKLEKIAITLPEAKVDDSRTTELKNEKFIIGEEIASEIGFTNNVFVDFGVYDNRQKNEASKTSQLIKNHPSDLAEHAVCWFDWFSSENSAIIRGLPAGDGKNGKKSEYCK